ncbi:MAG: DUF2973 domain-containing protein [Pleurocapsa sp.]
MLHLLYILAFTIVALLAVTNLIRSLITLSADTQKLYPPNYQSSSSQANSISSRQSNSNRYVHPELLDEAGKIVEEPLLVMRSVSVEDARQHLDALYEASPGKSQDKEEK